MKNLNTLLFENKRDIVKSLSTLTLGVILITNMSAYGPTCAGLNKGLTDSQIKNNRYEHCEKGSLCDYSLDLFFGFGVELALNYNIFGRFK